MTATRRKILAHLQKKRSSTAHEIARALNMRSPNIRHHLSILVSDGRVETMASRLGGQKGRPQKVYSLSQEAVGDNLAVLASALLSDARPAVSLEALAGRILEPAQFKELPLKARVSVLVEKLNAMHYHAHWEAGLAGPRVVLSHCPYAKIIARHPELCTMDAAVLEGALRERVEQISKMDKTHGACIFVMR